MHRSRRTSATGTVGHANSYPESDSVVAIHTLLETGQLYYTLSGVDEQSQEQARLPAPTRRHRYKYDASLVVIIRHGS